MKRSRTLVAIAGGVLFYVLFRYLIDLLMQRVSSPGLVTFWTVLSTPASMLVTLFPGFITGWFSRTKGILSGLIVGLAGSASYSALVGSAVQYFQVSSAQVVVSVSWFLVMCVVEGLYSAAAGGCAQLLRSNMSSKRTRVPRAA
jgi:hypothetical protein